MNKLIFKNVDFENQLRIKSYHELYSSRMKTWLVKPKFKKKIRVVGMTRGYYRIVPPNHLYFNFKKLIKNDKLFDAYGKSLACLVTCALYPNAKQWWGPEYRWVKDRMALDNSSSVNFILELLEETEQKP